MKRAALIGCALALAACGGDSGTAVPEPRSSSLVDANKPLPYISGFEIEPGTGDFLLTTNKGFWRIGSDDDSVTKIEATIDAGAGATAPVGNYLEIVFAGEDRLLGSGHPDADGQVLVKENLGLIESTDGGGTWTPVSDYGRTDLHKIIRLNGVFYAWDAIRSEIVISEDDGLNFDYLAAPPGFMGDFVVDPSDPDHLLFSTEEALFESENRGNSWRVIMDAPGIRLSWPEPGALLRIDGDGTTYAGDDDAASWERLGSFKSGLPARIKETDDPDHRYLALQDGEIRETTDGGRSWELVFRP